MKLVWTIPSPERVGDAAPQSLTGCYQDMLRSVGAWLDARGYRLAQITTSGESLLIEAEAGEPGDDLSREVIRLDYDALARLMQAARSDRNRFEWSA